MKNFLKSSFVSDELGQRRSERGPFSRIVADPAATSCYHTRRILSRRIIRTINCFSLSLRTSFAALVANAIKSLASHHSASSSFRNVRTSSRMITTHHIVSVTRSAVLSASSSARSERRLHHPLSWSRETIASGLSQSYL